MTKFSVLLTFSIVFVVAHPTVSSVIVFAVSPEKIPPSSVEELSDVSAKIIEMYYS